MCIIALRLASEEEVNYIDRHESFTSFCLHFFVIITCWPPPPANAVSVFLRSRYSFRLASNVHIHLRSVQFRQKLPNQIIILSIRRMEWMESERDKMEN